MVWSPSFTGEWGSSRSYPETWDVNPFHSLSCFALQNAQILPEVCSLMLARLLHRYLLLEAAPVEKWILLPDTFRWTKGSSDFHLIDSHTCLSEIVFLKLQTHFALLATLALTVLQATVLRTLGPSVLGVATPWSFVPLQNSPDYWLLFSSSCVPAICARAVLWGSISLEPLWHYWKYAVMA